MSPLSSLAILAAVLLVPTSVALADDPGGDAPTFDIGIEMTGMSDYMDSGLTNSDHKPSAGVTLTPSYDIFYGTIYGANIDYGASQPWLETKFAIGATPTFGPYSVDFNLARRIKFDDPSADRWVPYVTGTFTPNDTLTIGLGVGYYEYDARGTADFWEVYGTGTVTFDNSSYFTTELYWEPDQDGADNDYYGVSGTVGIPFLEKFEAFATLGYEAYEDNAATPSYLWSHVGLKYAFDDRLSLMVGYDANNLSSADCSLQAYTDCKSSLFAKLTYTVKLSEIVRRGGR